MAGKHPDRRIGKTREALASALFALMQRTAWANLTIQAICDEANVARASFYAHFGGKIELLDFVIERNVGGMAGNFASMGGGLAVLDWLVDHVTSSRKLFAKIALVPEALPVLARFKSAVADEFAAALQLEGAPASEAQVHFIVGGAFELMMRWSRQWQLKQVPALKRDIRDLAERVLDRRSGAR